MTFNFEAMKDILVCPKSKARLVHDEERLVSTDPETRLAYPIRDDIPIMLIDEATELSAEQWRAIMEKHGRDPQTGEEQRDDST